MAQHPDQIFVVATVPNEMEAGIIVAALERAGILSTMSGAETAGFRVGVPGEVQILVAEEDAESARQILEEAEALDEGDDFGDDDDDEGEADDEVDDEAEEDE
jgi:hypothetical protein